MSDRMRLMGMTSGMDTESIVKQLVEVKKVKVTNLKNDQKKHEWKQAAWQDLNSKIYGMYSNTLSQMRFSTAYSKKSTLCSDPTKATVVASESAVNGTQTLKIKQLAKTGYLTGTKLSKHTVTDPDDSTKTKEVDWTTADKLADISSDLVGKKINIEVGVGADAKTKEIEITEDMTITQFNGLIREAGLNASFDTNNQRFFISSAKTGAANEFKLDDGGSGALASLGIDVANGATKINAQDAIIELNGAEFESESNTISVNGLTINAVGVTEDEEISIVTSTDYDGVYDNIKNFIQEYNEIINEVYKKYNADSARKYNMLSEDEKEAMTDDEVEKWENTIKDSLLRRDDTLNSIMSMMTQVVKDPIVIDGKKVYLSDFGIGTLSYFEADEGERYALHINGDKEDDKTSDKDDKLKKLIAEDPEKVSAFFSEMAKSMYMKLDKMMGSTEYSSIYKLYNDKQMKTEYNDFNTKIKKAEQELSDYEDKWYDKFAAMETALSKMQSNQSAISGMLGS